jgi:hypothetical protein
MRWPFEGNGRESLSARRAVGRLDDGGRKAAMSIGVALAVRANGADVQGLTTGGRLLSGQVP